MLILNITIWPFYYTKQKKIISENFAPMAVRPIFVFPFLKELFLG
jgi:hypothetical protein